MNLKPFIYFVSGPTFTGFRFSDQTILRRLSGCKISLKEQHLSGQQSQPDFQNLKKRNQDQPVTEILLFQTVVMIELVETVKVMRNFVIAMG